MNALAADKIIIVGQQVHPDTSVHPTSIAYIQTILKPFADTIDPAPIEGVIQWIPLAFPGELAEHAMNELVKARRSNANTLQKPENDPDVETAAKDAIIEYIVAEILELAGNYTRDKGDSTIIPWDVQAAISGDKELSPMFSITETDKTLSVTVTVGGKQFTHMLGAEFTIGLLLFSLPTVGNHDFIITLFDTPFIGNYIVGNDDYRHRFVCPVEDDEEIITGYSVEVAGKRYCFDTADFMQGFATGALWSNRDHHYYWKNLIHYTNTLDTHKPIALPITF